MSEGRDPFSYFAIIAAPFGTYRPTESDRNNPLPPAAAGLAAAYRAKLREYKITVGGNPQPGPTATLFGQKVESDVTFLQLKLIYNELKPTLYVEWVVEAGPGI